MPWFCDNCGHHMLGRFCKCGSKLGATRAPPLDGLLFFDETQFNQGTPRFELMQVRESVNTRSHPHLKGSRPT